MLYKIKIKTEKKGNAEIVVIFIATTIIAMMVIKSRDVKSYFVSWFTHSRTYSLNYKTVFVNSQKIPCLFFFFCHVSLLKIIHLYSKRKHICHLIVRLLLNYFGIGSVAMEFFICVKTYKSYENTIKKPELMPSFTLLKAAHGGQTGVFPGPIVAPGPYV